MGNVTMALEDADEKRLRRLASEKFGGGKGSMAKTVKVALEKLENEDRRGAARKRLIESMRKGYDLGRIAVRHRSELYDRKIFG